MNRDKLIRYSDRVIEISLYTLIFCLPFSKAIIEISASLAIVTWVLKRIFSEYIGVHDAIHQKQTKNKFLRLVRAFKPAHTVLNIPIMAFVVVSSISLINTNYIVKSLEGFFFRWLEYVMLYFVIVETINNRKRFKNILTIMLISGAIIGIDGIFQYFTGVDFLRQRPLVENRITASFGYYNTFAEYLEAILPVYICLLLFGLRNNKIKLTMGMVAILLAICLALTQSRGAWLAFLAALIFIGFLKEKRILLSLVILLCILPFVVPNSVKERIAYTFEEGRNVTRMNIWRGAIRMIKDRPLFGHGLNTFMYNYPRYRADGGKGSDLAHNCYLMIAAETGMVGFAMFMWIILVLFKSSLSCLKRLREKAKEQLGRLDEALLLGLLAGAVANLTHSFVDNNLQTMQTATLFWFIVSLIIALQRTVGLDRKFCYPDS